MSEMHNPSTDVIEETKSTHRQCKICGTQALHSNFGAITCSACKVFFKRNGETGSEQFKCTFSGNCEINLNTRHACTSCRLAKCLSNGMSREMIRCSLPKRNTIKEKKKTAAELLITTTNILVPTLNLLQSDQSTLSSDQWNHISNLLHCYDEYGALQEVQSFTSEQNVLPFKSRYKSASIGEFYILILTKIQQIFVKNGDYLSLSSQDRNTMIHTTVKHATTFGGIVALDQTKLFGDPLFFKSNETLFGLDVMAAAKHVADYLDYDMTFIKLIIAVLSFSPTNYTVFTNTSVRNLIDIKTILRIQDTYTELAWRYMVYKHSHEHAVTRFSQLIRNIFYLQRAVVGVDTVQEYTDIVNSVVEQTKHIVIISD